MEQTTLKRKELLTALAPGARSIIIIAFIAITIGSTWRTALGQTNDIPPRPQRAQITVYGPHTLSRTQTLHLTVVNAALSEPPDPSTPGEGEPPDPIRPRRVTLAFDIYARASEPPDPNHSTADGDGSVRTLRLMRRVSRTFMLRPGQGATLEIEGARAGDAVGAWVLGEPPDPNTPGESEPPDPIRSAVTTSLEVRQGNSTQFILPGTTRGFNPQPDPPRDR
jgi:hypothetical protein